MAEDRQPISSSRITAADAARHSFATVRRGFDPQSVRAYLELVARELMAWEQRDEELRHELAQAEERARNPVIDEATLTAALGQQSAQVLRRAHEEAARITQQAEEAAATLSREAQTHASELRVQAESGAAERIAQAEIEAGSVHQQTRAEVAQVLEGARAEGELLLARAREQGQAMIDQAQETRRRILADMAQRRRAMTLQIEQFRAARDELAASVSGLRDSVDRVIGELAQADDRARAAAAEVARRQPQEPGGPDAPGEPATGEVPVELPGGPAGGPAGIAAPAGEEAGGPAGEEAGGPAGEEAGGGPVDVTLVVPVTGPTGATGVIDEAAAADESPVAGQSPAGADLGVVATPEIPGDVSAAVGDQDDAGDSDAGDSVEELFARLRAGHAPTGEQRPVPAAPEVAPADPAHAPEAGAQPVGGGGDPEAEGGGGDPEAKGEPDADALAVARWAELLHPVAGGLARVMKRALQDDQNRVLERLRANSGVWAGDVLAPEEEQRATYVEAARDGLARAMAAGIGFAREHGSPRGRAPAPDAKAVEQAAETLAVTVVSLLRRRLEEGEAGEGSDAGADRVGAAYREWRGARIERLVGDAAHGAFAAGVLAGTGRGAGTRWVVDPSGQACADCEDNALGGVVALGDEFPTGHRAPPAHPGCRCLVVPTPA